MAPRPGRRRRRSPRPRSCARGSTWARRCGAIFARWIRTRGDPNLPWLPAHVVDGADRARPPGRSRTGCARSPGRRSGARCTPSARTTCRARPVRGLPGELPAALPATGPARREGRVLRRAAGGRDLGLRADRRRSARHPQHRAGDRRLRRAGARRHDRLRAPRRPCAGRRRAGAELRPRRRARPPQRRRRRTGTSSASRTKARASSSSASRRERTGCSRATSSTRRRSLRRWRRPSPHYVTPDDPSLGPAARQFVVEPELLLERRAGGRAAARSGGRADAASPRGGRVLRARLRRRARWPGTSPTRSSPPSSRPSTTPSGSLWWQVGATQQVAPAAQFSQPAVDACARTARRSDLVRRLRARGRVGDRSARQRHDGRRSTTTSSRPWRITDPNGNVSEVRYDPLGVVVAATSYGTVAAPAVGLRRALRGDRARAGHPRRRAREPERSTCKARPASPGTTSAPGRPTACRRRSSRLTAEQLLHDGAGGGTRGGRIQVGVAYLDGLGRTLQEKTLVEDGPAIQRDAQGNVVVDGGREPRPRARLPRWRVSGHVVYDTKEHPGRQYEPFFSPSVDLRGRRRAPAFGVSTPGALRRGRAGRSGKISRTARSRARRSARGRSSKPTRTTTSSAPRTELLAQGLPSGSAELQAYQEAVPARRHDGAHVPRPARAAQAGSLAQGGPTAADRRTTTQLDIAGAVLQVTDPRGLVGLHVPARHAGPGAVYEQGIDAGAGLEPARRLRPRRHDLGRPRLPDRWRLRPGESADLHRRDSGATARPSCSSARHQREQARRGRPAPSSPRRGRRTRRPRP